MGKSFIRKIKLKRRKEKTMAAAIFSMRMPVLMKMKRESNKLTKTKAGTIMKDAKTMKSIHSGMELGNLSPKYVIAISKISKRPLPNPISKVVCTSWLARWL